MNKEEESGDDLRRQSIGSELAKDHTLMNTPSFDKLNRWVGRVKPNFSSLNSNGVNEMYKIEEEDDSTQRMDSSVNVTTHRSRIN